MLENLRNYLRLQWEAKRKLGHFFRQEKGFQRMQTEERYGYIRVYTKYHYGIRIGNEITWLCIGKDGARFIEGKDGNDLYILGEGRYQETIYYLEKGKDVVCLSSKEGGISEIANNLYLCENRAKLITLKDGKIIELLKFNRMEEHIYYLSSEYFQIEVEEGKGYSIYRWDEEKEQLINMSSSIKSKKPIYYSDERREIEIVETIEDGEERQNFFCRSTDGEYKFLLEKGYSKVDLLLKNDPIGKYGFIAFTEKEIHFFKKDALIKGEKPYVIKGKSIKEIFEHNGRTVYRVEIENQQWNLYMTTSKGELEFIGSIKAEEPKVNGFVIEDQTIYFPTVI